MTAFAAPFNPTPQQAPRFDAAYEAWNTVATYDDYTDAQRAVDRLSDDGFPVQNLDIVGSDLRLVERVTGRLTNGRAAAAGAASGAWFGLLIGLLLGIFTADGWFGLIAVAVVIGAAWGAAFGFFGHRAARGRRDFASARMLVATHYAVVARNGQVDAARSALVSSGLLSAA
ncbi:general stress protein [uncultured Jatrophihabitans sp.]|uniref:general stress protein n=1 Tax=uncultured Jatrophihabitans sp. TaxID=1610747 RepID=UPI0035CA72B3